MGLANPLAVGRSGRVRMCSSSIGTAGQAGSRHGVCRQLQGACCRTARVLPPTPPARDLSAPTRPGLFGRAGPTLVAWRGCSRRTGQCDTGSVPETALRLQHTAPKAAPWALADAARGAQPLRDHPPDFPGQSGTPNRPKGAPRLAVGAQDQGLSGSGLTTSPGQQSARSGRAICRPGSVKSGHACCKLIACGDWHGTGRF